MNNTLIKIGINARLFPSNWRPFIEEVKFSQLNGFNSIQISVRDKSLDNEFLGNELNLVADALHEAELELAIELLIATDEYGQTLKGETPIEILKTNLDAIATLQCKYVHWHLVPLVTENTRYGHKFLPDAISRLEKLLMPQFSEGVALAQKSGFEFGFEHNEPESLLFSIPQSCKMLMNAVPGLKFVWDINHTSPTHLPEFQDLVSDASVVHISDTKLPNVNYHLPLGRGSVNFEHIAKSLLEKKFEGPAILEIGGLMKSGGYGRDTDDALIESYRHLQAAIDSVMIGG